MLTSLSAQEGNQLLLYYTEKSGAGVISTGVEFTLANWNLNFHSTVPCGMLSHNIKIEQKFCFGYEMRFLYDIIFKYLITVVTCVKMYIENGD